MAGGANTVPHLEATLGGRTIEGAEGTLEAPVHVLGRKLVGLGEGIAGHETGEGHHRENETSARHGSQPFVSGAATAPTGVAAGCESTGV